MLKSSYLLFKFLESQNKIRWGFGDGDDLFDILSMNRIEFRVSSFSISFSTPIQFVGCIFVFFIRFHQ